MAISKHRQWRAWQFGMRHSGAMRGGTDRHGGGYNPLKDPDKWLRNGWLGCVVAVVMGSLLFISPPLFYKVIAGLLVIGLVIGVVNLFR